MNDQSMRPEEVLAAKDAEIERLKAERDEARAETHGALTSLLEMATVLACGPKESPIEAAKRVVGERDAAVADNAGLTRTIRDLLATDDLPRQGIRNNDAVANAVVAVAAEHPGATLLEEHQKALVRARNEGLRTAAKMARNVGLGNLASVISAAEEPEQCSDASCAKCRSGEPCH